MHCGRLGFDPWVRKIPWRREVQSTLVFLPGEFHGQRSLEGYSPWGRKELDIPRHDEDLRSLSCGAREARSPWGRRGGSVAESYLTLCDPMDCSMPGFPAHHQLLELAQTHVHRVSDATQPSHLLLSPSPTFNLSKHQSNATLCFLALYSYQL